MSDLDRFKRESMRIAKQLCYPKEILARIVEAKTEREVGRILTMARHQMED